MVGPYPARTHTYVAGDQVAANDLNDIQDGVVGCSDEIENIEDNLLPLKLGIRTATCNQSDSPAPDIGGGHAVWVEKSTNGTNSVVLDNHIDWRDRFVDCRYAFEDTPAYLPGGGIDGGSFAPWPALYGGTVHLSAHYGMWYTGPGWDGVGATAYTQSGQPTGWAEYVRIFARDTDGALVMVKNAHAIDPDIHIVGRFECSPVQNHY